MTVDRRPQPQYALFALDCVHFLARPVAAILNFPLRFISPSFRRGVFSLPILYFICITSVILHVLQIPHFWTPICLATILMCGDIQLITGKIHIRYTYTLHWISSKSNKLQQEIHKIITNTDPNLTPNPIRTHDRKNVVAYARIVYRIWILSCN